MDYYVTKNSPKTSVTFGLEHLADNTGNTSSFSCKVHSINATNMGFSQIKWASHCRFSQIKWVYQENSLFNQIMWVSLR